LWGDISPIRPNQEHGRGEESSVEIVAQDNAANGDSHPTFAHHCIKLNRRRDSTRRAVTDEAIWREWQDLLFSGAAFG
jgi:hypothetical protein